MGAFRPRPSGLAVGPATGRMLAELMSGEPPFVDSASVRPDRYRRTINVRANLRSKIAVGAWHGSYSGRADLSLARAQRAWAAGRIRTPDILPKVPGVGEKFPAGCSRPFHLSHCKDAHYSLRRRLESPILRFSLFFSVMAGNWGNGDRFDRDPRSPPRIPSTVQSLSGPVADMPEWRSWPVAAIRCVAREGLAQEGRSRVEGAFGSKETTATRSRVG